MAAKSTEAKFDVAGRLSRLRERMEQEEVDAFLALRSVSVEYLTGFDHIRDTEDPHAVLVTADEARFVTDARYFEVAMAENTATGALWQVENSGSKWIPQELHELWDLATHKTIATEDLISQRHFALLAHNCAPAELRATSAWVERLRRTKDAAELARIAAAQAITDAAFSHICSFLRCGQSEQEIAVELEYSLRHLGADALAFPSIVASGSNGSLPHAVPGERRIAPGDFVTLDFGAAFGGYCSDMTRTICVGGEPSTEQRRVYQAVLDAQLADLAVLRDGLSGIAGDTPGRELIAAAGYGEYFTHGTSHGVGLEIHEAPSASARSKDTLHTGDVISCEPGIYLPGKLGVRIEDLVAVEPGGIRNFTASPKELLILPG